jgi:hypothetical protein
MARSKTKGKAKTTSNYLMRDLPPELLLEAKHRAVDEGCTVRELLLRGLELVLQRKIKQ